MFKAIFRVAIAFAVVWMLVPHGAAVEFARPGFAAVAHHFGWLHTPADFKAPDTSPSANQSSAARDCASPVVPKRYDRNGQKSQHSASATDGSVSASVCPDHGGRQSSK